MCRMIVTQTKLVVTECATPLLQDAMELQNVVMERTRLTVLMVLILFVFYFNSCVLYWDAAR